MTPGISKSLAALSTIAFLALTAFAAHADEPPTVPIETRFQLDGVLRGPTKPRTDLSGLVILMTAPQPLALVVDDKPSALDSALARAELSFAPPSGKRPPLLRLERLQLRNPDHLPLGQDFEDMARLPAASGPGEWLAVVGEQEPFGQGTSWLVILAGAGSAWSVVDSRVASPDGESVGNDGLEGVAMTRIGSDTLAVITMKERPDPYIRSWLYRETAITDSTRMKPLTRPVIDRIDGVRTQAGATFGPGGDLYVLDRYSRRIALVDRARLLAAIADTTEELIPVREWLDFTTFEPRLENKVTGGGPLSPFGTAEGIAFDEAGRLYLLSDNNETGGSVLLRLVPIAPLKP